MRLVAQAILAPSSHNEQPWRIRFDTTAADTLYLYADPRRLTPEVDPVARQTMVSQGTFVQYLRVAARAAGIDVAVTLFPDGDYDEADLVRSMDTRPVAAIRLRPGTTPDDTDHASLFLSDTNRSPYTDDAVTDEEAEALGGLAEETGPSLELFRDPADVERLGAFALRGSIIESTQPAIAAESAAIFRPNEYRKNEMRWGFAVEGQGTTGIMKYLLQGITTLAPVTNDPASAAARDVALATGAEAHTASYSIIQTDGNTRADQVEAGMLYAALALRARSLGLVVQPVSQVLEEYPAMRDEHLAVHEQYAEGRSTIQMLVRIGTATVDYPPTMRREPRDLLIATARNSPPGSNDSGTGPTLE